MSKHVVTNAVIRFNPDHVEGALKDARSAYSGKPMLDFTTALARVSSTLIVEVEVHIDENGGRIVKIKDKVDHE